MLKNYVLGGEIGKNVKIFDTKNVFIDNTRPWLLHIGDYTKITRGVIILTHDYSLDVLRRVYGEWIGEGETTWIGDNVFIGMNSVILMGSHIGNNVIIGAGSVVHGSVPDNVVIAGNPAKVLCTLEEHYNRRKKKTIDEALHCARRFYEVTGKKPTEQDLSSFHWLFLPRTKEAVERCKLSFNVSGDEPLEVENAFYSSIQTRWDNFDEFIKEAIELDGE